MTDIDWRAVQFVCDGYSLKLTTDEKRAVVRRLAHKMRRTSSVYEDGITAEDVARRLQTETRSVTRYLAELNDATEQQCPVCRQRVWVLAGVIEPHQDRRWIDPDDCPMTGHQTVRGLAALRPDLYQWAFEGVPA